MILIILAIVAFLVGGTCGVAWSSARASDEDSDRNRQLRDAVRYLDRLLTDDLTRPLIPEATQTEIRDLINDYYQKG